MELQGGRSSQKENDHAISMVLAMVIAFFVCWLPYTILSIVVVVDPELYIPPLVATMPMYFAKTSPVYNPIIYFLLNQQVGLLHFVMSVGGSVWALIPLVIPNVVSARCVLDNAPPSRGHALCFSLFYGTGRL